MWCLGRRQLCLLTLDPVSIKTTIFFFRKALYEVLLFLIILKQTNVAKLFFVFSFVLSSQLSFFAFRLALIDRQGTKKPLRAKSSWWSHIFVWRSLTCKRRLKSVNNNNLYHICANLIIEEPLQLQISSFESSVLFQYFVALASKHLLQFFLLSAPLKTLTSLPLSMFSRKTLPGIPSFACHGATKEKKPKMDEATSYTTVFFLFNAHGEPNVVYTFD